MNLNQTDTNMEMANQNIRNINELMKLNQRIQAGKELSQEDKDYHEKLILCLNQAMQVLKK